MATDDFGTHARLYLGGARTALHDLEEILGRDHSPREVAQTRDRLNHSFKFAEICALVAIGDRLGDLAEAIDDGRLSLDEVDDLVTQALEERAS